jgi:hypothetical protein
MAAGSGKRRSRPIDARRGRRLESYPFACRSGCVFPLPGTPWPVCSTGGRDAAPGQEGRSDAATPGTGAWRPPGSAPCPIPVGREGGLATRAQPDLAQDRVALEPPRASESRAGHAQPPGIPADLAIVAKWHPPFRGSTRVDRIHGISGPPPGKDVRAKQEPRTCAAIQEAGRAVRALGSKVSAAHPPRAGVSGRASGSMERRTAGC